MCGLVLFCFVREVGGLDTISKRKYLTFIVPVFGFKSPGIAYPHKNKSEKIRQNRTVT